jgi:C1A family cysteine protease
MRVSFFISFMFLFLFSGLLSAQEENGPDFDRIRVDPVGLPVSFDLRGSGMLSEIKVQPTGGCWSSSATATIEPWWRKTGLGDYQLSDRNLQLTHGFDDSRNTYGNHFMATAYFSRGSGPVDKNAGLDSIALLRPQVPFILTDARYVPGDASLIKQTIMDYGPVYTMLYFKRRTVDTLDFVMGAIENPRQAINHAVVLVGWDDALSTPLGEGAWIAQNSLGKKFGEEGFFYVPYQNRDILKHNAVWNGWMPFGDRHRILYYDTLGSFESYGFNDSICYGLTKFTVGSDCRLVRLASHINNPGTDLSFEVYSGFDTTNRKLTGKIGKTTMKRCVFPGYYTLDLTDTLPLKSGNEFYVMARYITPNNTQPLPVEHAIEDYSDPHLTEGKNWVNPNIERWPETWYACGRNTPYPALEFDLCIRAIVEIEKK